MKILAGLLTLWACGILAVMLTWAAARDSRYRAVITMIVSIVWMFACLLFGLYGFIDK